MLQLLNINLINLWELMEISNRSDLVKIYSYGDVEENKCIPDIHDVQRLSIWHPSQIVGRRIVSLEIADDGIMLELEEETVEK